MFWSGWELAPPSWEALATLVTGAAAVTGAVIVGKRQVSLQKTQTELIQLQADSEREFRTTEIKLNLLNRRADLIALIREVNQTFIQNAKLEQEDLSKLISAMNEAQLIFPKQFYGTLQNVLVNAIRSQSKFWLSESRHKQGKETEARNAMDEAFAMEEKVFDELPSVLESLIEHAAVTI